MAHGSVATDPADSAEAAGLRYVSDTTPGIRRSAGQRGSATSGPTASPSRRQGRPRSASARSRFRRRRPTSGSVPRPNGHIQATGRDARGRKQYRYHPRGGRSRDETKFGRMLAFSEALPTIRAARRAGPAPARAAPREGARHRRPAARVHRHPRRQRRVRPRPTSRSASPRCGTEHVEVSRVHAALRVPRQERQDAHASRSPTGGSRASCARCQALPGAELFQYRRRRRRAADDRLRRRERLPARDHRRGLHGQGLPHLGRHDAGASRRCATIGPAATGARGQVGDRQAIDQVAEQLNNTRAVCRKYYVHPAVFESYLAGTLHEALQNGGPPKGAARTR